MEYLENLEVVDICIIQLVALFIFGAIFMTPSRFDDEEDT